MFDAGGWSRRAALKGFGAAAVGGTSLGGMGGAVENEGTSDGVADADGTGETLADGFGTVVDVVEAGGDPTGGECVTPILREHAADDTLFRFPEGRYRMAEQFRFTGFENLGLVGDGATIVPDDYHDFEGEPRCFKLGTYYAPGRDLRFEGLDFDFTADDTGVRALQAQVADGLRVSDVTVRGVHDSGTWGPFLFDVTDPDGDGFVDRVRLPDGGAYSTHCPGDVWTGPTGVLVSRFHEGHLRLRDCDVGPFPDNGLYARNGARTTVVGGEYRNSNVASIRIGGDGSEVRGATVVVDANRPGDENQTGIRLDRGADLRVLDTEVRVSAPNGPAVNVQNEVDSAAIRRSEVAVGGGTGVGVVVQGGAGRTIIEDAAVRFDGGGNALLLRPRADGGGAVVCERVSVVGDAHGYDGRHAIRCARAGTVLRDVTVDQPGDGYRRCLEVSGDDCLVRGGAYRSTHHPIVNAASGTRVVDVDHAEAYDGRAALKLLDGHADVSILRNVLYEGVLDKGTENLTMAGNETPSR